MHGFLGTEASFREDLNLTVQLAMGIALLVGRGFAKRRNFRAHQICQSTVVVLNLIFIFLIMAPSFRRQVAPHFFSALHDFRFAIPMAHAMLGIVAELLGLYIVLAAGTKILPEWVRFKHYKPWMKTALALWWSVILLGIGIYFSWYVFPAKNRTVLPVSSTAALVTVTNFDFAPKTMTIRQNGTVRFVDKVGRHKIVFDEAGFESPDLLSGSYYEHRFTHPGTFHYHCDFHGEKGGVGMAGVVVVR